MGRAVLGLDTPRKVAIFFGYMVLGCWTRGYIYYSTHAEGFPPYDRAAVVTAVGCCKLALAAGFFLAVDGSAVDLARQWRAHTALFGKYFGLAVLYAVYDNLTFAALALLSPYTYQIVQQLRLVLTAVLWQLLFRRRLQCREWVAIAVISVTVALFNVSESAAASENDAGGGSGSDGVAVDDDADDDSGGLGKGGAHSAAAAAAVVEAVAKRALGVALALVQILCAVTAGVVCEYFLKNQSTASVPLNLQNCFMCVVVGGRACGMPACMRARARERETE
jgi:drug/metabolite transporter (DMT)-like permease